MYLLFEDPSAYSEKNKSPQDVGVYALAHAEHSSQRYTTGSVVISEEPIVMQAVRVNTSC